MISHIQDEHVSRLPQIRRNMASHRITEISPPLYGGNNFTIGAHNGSSGPNSILETASQRSIGMINPRNETHQY